MIDHILSIRLKPALERLRRRRMKIGYLIGTAVAIVVLTGMLLYARSTPEANGVTFETARLLMLAGGLAFGAVGALIGRGIKPNIRQVALQVEEQFPELNGRLVTAVQQNPGDDGMFTFLQEHLAAEAIHHSTENDWKMIVPDSWMRNATVAHVMMLVAFLTLWWMLPGFSATGKDSAEEQSESAGGVTVTPGDTELEKGTTLVMLARFDEPVPGAVELVIGESTESERRLALNRSLSDPVFGGSVPEVQDSFTYKVAWEGGSSESYKVKVYEFPKLERSDATLTYPGYTKLAPKRIEDTRHISAVEGTRVDLELALNKPVASAVLEPRKAKDAATAPEALLLEVSPDKASAFLRGHVPAQSGRYELVLTDADGRSSKQSVPFSFDVIPNRVPEMKLASPKGDQKPSALQEIPFDGTVWDDFGVVACGLEIETPGGQTVTVEFGKDVPGKEKRAFQQLVKMEELKAVPDQLFAWHTWADDFGPDGKVRRTKGDLYFAEIRAFEQIFRQGEGMTPEQQRQQQQQQQQQQGQQGQAEQLVKLQKQIITATWKLAQRSGTDKTSKLNEDLKVVRDSQEDARAQAEAAAGKAGASPVTASLWQGALQQMQQALERLEKATEAPPEVSTAIGPEQAAYQALLKLQAKEFQVAMQNQQQQQQQSGQQGQNQGEQQQQRQLDQLDLAKNEERYETQREAQAQQSAERREQMQVLNRLKELAQRQQDVNEKLKELQSALSEAKTKEEKEAAKRELKRLEDEQRQMLADADELRQRMEQQQNQSENSEQREQLEQAREKMQQAAEAAAQGQASQALASGKRAEEQMEKMKEEMRKQSAGAFEEELRQMRADARELARKQEDIAKGMKGEEGDPGGKADEQNKPREANKPGEPDKAETANNAERKEAPSLGGPDEDEKLAEDLRKQEERTGDLVQRAQELSEQAEGAEPLLSRQIYETARQFTQNDAGVVKQLQQELMRERLISNDKFEELKQLQERERGGRALRLASELQRQNRTREATRITNKASQELNRLRDGIEQAAESVLGDDTASLRLAEQQLREAAEAMQREIEQQTGRQPGEQNQNRQANAGGRREGQPQEGQRQRSGQRPENGEQEPREGEPQNTAQARNENQNQPPREGEQPPQDGKQNGRQPQGQQEGQANARQPGQRQGNGGRPQSGEQQEQQPNERQPGEQNPETAQNEPREGQQPQEGEGQQQQQPGERQGQQEANQSGQNREGQQTADSNTRSAQREPGASNGGGGGGPQDSAAPRGPVGNRRVARDPLTGEGFTNWSDRLREAEELVDETELRNEIAKARERARQMRLDMRHDGGKPNWGNVELEVVKPLVEVRDRLRQELARRDSDKALVPVDRDPVPAQFSENVRRYYEQLGKDQ